MIQYTNLTMSWFSYVKPLWTRWAKYRVLIGCSLICISLGVSFYAGNLVTYSSSYFRFRLCTKAELLNADWMISSFMIGVALGTILSGPVADYIPRLKIFIFGSLIVFDTSITVTYFTTQYSMLASFVTSMLIPGLAAGMILALCTKIIKDWFEEGLHVGLAIAILSAFYALGGLVFNPLITSFINPRNLAPNFIEKGTRYFSQWCILNRYPFVFLLLGGVSAGINIIGCLLIKIRKVPRFNDKNSFMNDKSSGNKSPTPKSNTFNQSASDNVRINTKNNQTTPRSEYFQTDKVKNAYNISAETDNSNSTTQNDTDYININKQNDNEFGHQNRNKSNSSISVSENTKPSQVDLTLRQVLTSTNFYLLLYTNFAFTFGVLVTINFYKRLAQVRIGDDFFISVIGSINVIPISIARFFTGFSSDKWGVKVTIISAAAVICILMIFWAPALYENRAAYTLTTSMLSGLTSIVFAFIPICAQKVLGPTHFNVKYGLLVAPLILSSILVPILTSNVSDYISVWMWIFNLTAILFAIVVVAMLLFFHP